MKTSYQLKSEFVQGLSYSLCKLCITYIIFVVQPLELIYAQHVNVKNDLIWDLLFAFGAVTVSCVNGQTVR